MQMRIGTLYLEGRHFQAEANQTVGAALVGPDLAVRAANRRAVTSAVTDLGRAAKQRVVDLFASVGLKVKLQWSIHAGCTMCPCSPGFKIVAEVSPEQTEAAQDCLRWRSRDDKETAKVNIWIGDDEKPRGPDASVDNLYAVRSRSLRQDFFKRLVEDISVLECLF